MDIKPLSICIFVILSGGYNSVAQTQWGTTLAPDYVAVQYAGSVGWTSIAVGYNILKKKARLGVHYGFVPSAKGGELHILSTSFFYKPLVEKVSDQITINPLDLGVKFSYQFGDDYYFKWPDRFPMGYYWWKSALRIHLATESSVTWHLKPENKVKAITGYIEFNTNDLYLISYVQNFSSLSITDIVKTGIGVRVNF